MMGAVTYQEPAVVKTIDELFVPVQVNTQDAANKPILERFRQFWTPDLRVIGSDGFDYLGWNGYLPPFELVPQLLVGIARADMRCNQEAQAVPFYEEVLRRFPTSQAAPEAQYYLAVARYKSSHEGSDLLGGWRDLRLRYPESPWRTRQLFAEK